MESKYLCKILHLPIICIIGIQLQINNRKSFTEQKSVVFIDIGILLTYIYRLPHPYLKFRNEIYEISFGILPKKYLLLVLKLLTGTVPVNNSLLTRIPKKLKLHQISPSPQSNPKCGPISARMLTRLLKTIFIHFFILSMLAYPGMHAIAACPVEPTKSVGLRWVSHIRQ